MSEGLWSLLGAGVGSGLTIFATWYFYKRKEKERQKIIIAVIDAKLSFLFQQYLLTENGIDIYSKIKHLAENLFKNATYERILDTKRKLKEYNIDQEIKEFLQKTPTDYLKILLETIIKDDFLVNDHDCVFLGKAFLVDKIEIRSCCEAILFFFYSDTTQQKNMQDIFLYNILRGLYLFEKLRKLIKSRA
ncbi:MAG: hypothetical protein K2X98_02300 [Alphaproteobacteria bacterium]|nr:hypothetical protein [Alphaproteobacteria bacterium]